MHTIYCVWSLLLFNDVIKTSPRSTINAAVENVVSAGTAGTDELMMRCTPIPSPGPPDYVTKYSGAMPGAGGPVSTIREAPSEWLA